MSGQLDLLAWAPRYPLTPAATKDDTSREAAEAIRPRSHILRDKVLACLKRQPLTVHECARLLRETVPAVQPRFSELRAMDLIADSGERRLNDSGRKAIVWRAA